MPATRKRLRLPDYDYQALGPYFVTVCLQRRDPLFGRVENGKILLSDIGVLVSEI